MDIAARIDELVNRGFDNGLIAAITGVDPTGVADFRRTRVAPQDPMAGGGSSFAYLFDGPGGAWVGETSSSPDGLWLDESGQINAWLATPTSNVISAQVDTDVTPRFYLLGSGQMHWGDGVNPPDTKLVKDSNSPAELNFIAPNAGDAPWLYMVGTGNYGAVNLRADPNMEADGSTPGPFSDVYMRLAENGGFQVYPPSDPTLLAFQSGLYGEGNRFQIAVDGTMSWADGNNPPDTKLARKDSHALETERLLLGTETDVELYWTGTGTGVVTNAGPGRIQLQTPQSGSPESVLAMSVQISGESQPRFTLASEGRMLWGDGTLADIGIARTSAGTIAIGDADHLLGGDGAATFFGVDGVGASFLYVQSHDGNDFVKIAPESQYAIHATKPGAGIRLVSPDGTQHKTITIDDTGAIALI